MDSETMPPLISLRETDPDTFETNPDKSESHNGDYETSRSETGMSNLTALCQFA